MSDPTVFRVSTAMNGNPFLMEFIVVVASVIRDDDQNGDGIASRGPERVDPHHTIAVTDHTDDETV